MQWSKPEGHPVKYPHSDSQSWISLLYGCKELLHLLSWMGNPESSLWISYWRVILWSLCGPHGEASRKDRDWGNDTSCSIADQYGEIQGFFPTSALPEGFKIPRVGDPYHHLLSFCGDCRGLDSGYWNTFLYQKGKHSSGTHLSPLMLYVVLTMWLTDSPASSCTRWNIPWMKKRSQFITFVNWWQLKQTKWNIKEGTDGYR